MMKYKSRQVRGMVKHMQRPGQVAPSWMLCWHTLDALCWAPLFRAQVISSIPKPKGRNHYANS